MMTFASTGRLSRRFLPCPSFNKTGRRLKKTPIFLQSSRTIAHKKPPLPPPLFESSTTNNALHSNVLLPRLLHRTATHSFYMALVERARHSFTTRFAIAFEQMGGSSFAWRRPGLRLYYSLAGTLHTQLSLF